MKMQEARDIINKISKGFMISFEDYDGRGFRGHHFPDKHAGESLIPTEEEAWALAKLFAENCPKSYVNIHVINCDFTSVGDEKLRDIKELQRKAFVKEMCNEKH